MLKKEDAIAIEKVPYTCTLKNGKKRTLLYKLFCYKCIDCGGDVKSQESHLPKHSGKCVNCSQRGRPFEAAYNELVKSKHISGQKEVELTYEEFLEYTKETKCHYCYHEIIWHLHTKQNGKDIKGSRSYKLDRKDNDKGYNKENCVVCCWPCNQAKGNRYTYEEWYGMTEYFRKRLTSKIK